jgi:2-(1,2-epoxy-1,2-dihydrophenyl)acetyl-CoA isomerase
MSDVLEVRDDAGVRWLRLNRPDARNAIDGELRDALEDGLLEADADPDVRALVIAANGRDFCTGGDLSPPSNPEGAVQRPPVALDYRRGVSGYQALFRTYWEIETPVVSAVSGTTAGIGWMLALLADVVVAAEGARWIHVFGERGMVPHGGDPFFLPRVLPFHRITAVALLGERVTSETLHEWGAVTRLVPPDQVDATAGELAAKIAQGPTRSLGQARRLYRRSLVSDMATAFAEEAAAVALISQTDDRMEGVRSMLERRPAQFQGR